MEAWVADRTASRMEAAASSSNSKFPAILIILLNDRVFKNLQHILLNHSTFEIFPNSTQRSKNKTEQKNKCQFN